MHTFLSGMVLQFTCCKLGSTFRSRELSCGSSATGFPSRTTTFSSIHPLRTWSRRGRSKENKVTILCKNIIHSLHYKWIIFEYSNVHWVVIVIYFCSRKYLCSLEENNIRCRFYYISKSFKMLAHYFYTNTGMYVYKTGTKIHNKNCNTTNWYNCILKLLYLECIHVHTYT